MAALVENSLSRTLRSRTATAHGDAEQSLFMEQLFSGALSRVALADYTGQLWFLYSALERAVRAHAGGNLLASVADPRLERVPALERDMVELGGEFWRDEIVPGPGTVAYIRHLDGLADAGDQLGLLAHHYVRYLGDLSGGQVIARMFREHYGVGADGLHFYDFALIGKIKPYRDGYRERLDGLSLGELEISRLLSAANEAFGLNQAVFRDLAGRHCRIPEAG